MLVVRRGLDVVREGAEVVRKDAEVVRAGMLVVSKEEEVFSEGRPINNFRITRKLS